jgi:methyltransferase-like protein
MGSFSRTINDSLAKPADSMVFKYKESINSVFYFALLPYKLDDPAVIANRLPDEQIEGKKHYKMNKYAEVDSTDFPIIKLIFTGEAANTENFQLYLNELKQNYSSKQPIAIVFDATKAVLPGIKYQKMQAQWLKDNEQLMKDFCAGTAYVIPNRIIRNVLSAIFALQKQPVPYQICSHRSEAEDWVNSQLETLRS